MQGYIVIGLIIIITIIAMAAEMMDRNTFLDIPHCGEITNNCTEYGNKQNVKYVIKEPNETETVDMILTRIENTIFQKLQLVYWRMSLIIALLICLLYYVFNTLAGYKIEYQSYFFIFVSAWFLNYFMRNYLDFHYHKHLDIRVKESIKQLRNKLK